MLSGYKTYITGGLAILGAVASFLTGDITVVQMASLIIPAIMGMTIRHGITTAVAK